MWLSDRLAYERGFHAITAGVAWVSRGAPLSPLTDLTTRKVETETGFLLKEIPGGLEAIIEVSEAEEMTAKRS